MKAAPLTWEVERHANDDTYTASVSDEFVYVLYPSVCGGFSVGVLEMRAPASVRLIGTAPTLDEGKAVAQAHADKLYRALGGA